MATNTGKDGRKGSVKERTQSHNPTAGQWVEPDASTGEFVAANKDGEPFKEVRKEPRKISISKDIDRKEVFAMLKTLKKLDAKSARL